MPHQLLRRGKELERNELDPLANKHVTTYCYAFEIYSKFMILGSTNARNIGKFLSQKPTYSKIVVVRSLYINIKSTNSISHHVIVEVECTVEPAVMFHPGSSDYSSVSRYLWPRCLNVDVVSWRREVCWKTFYQQFDECVDSGKINH